MSKSEQASISNTNTEVLEQLTRPLKLSFPVIKVQTFEIARAELALQDAAEKVGKHFHKMEFQQIPSPPEIQKIAKETEKKREITRRIRAFCKAATDRRVIFFG